MRSTVILAFLLASFAGCVGQAGEDADDPAGALEEAKGRAPGLPPQGELAPAFPGGPLVAEPLTRGPLAWTRLDYDFGVLVADAPGNVPPAYPVAIRGEVTVPDGAGPFPLVVLMHGRHGTCDIAGFEVLGAYACPNAVVVTPVDSYQGYRPVADLLASHGYVVASIDANDINERDQAPISQSMVGTPPDYGARARGELTLQTITFLGDANATGTAGMPEQDLSALRGRIDLSRIGLMGHSRGGEGVATAVVLNNEAGAPHAIRALFALAPTDFARWTPTGVPFATLLPYCDGDVSTLHGSWMHDDLRDVAGAGTLHQVTSMGADHNFYNDRWTGDDWGERDDPWCDLEDGAGRDDAPAQMTQGAAVMSSFFRMLVGREDGFDAYWTGEVPFPDGACAQPCAPRLLVSRHAPDGERHVVSADGVGDVAGDVRAQRCEPGDGCRGGSIGRAARANVTWEGPGTLRFAVAPGAPDGMDVLTFRAAVHAAQATFTLRLLDEDGTVLAEHALDAPALTPSPGDAAKKLVLNQVRVPLGDVTLTRLASVELALTGTGEAQLADVMLQHEA